MTKPGLYTYYKVTKGDTLRGIMMDYYQCVEGRFADVALSINGIDNIDQKLPAGSTIKLLNFGRASEAQLAALQRRKEKEDGPMAKLRAGIRNAERGLRTEQSERAEAQGLRRDIDRSWGYDRDDGDFEDGDY